MTTNTGRRSFRPATLRVELGYGRVQLLDVGSLANKAGIALSVSRSATRGA